MSSSDTYPENILIDTTTVCNARCPFCPLFQGVSQMDREIRPAHIMSEEMYESILAEMATWRNKPSVINQSVNCEPLQDPKFVNRMTILKKYSFGEAMRLVTNATFLNEKAAAAICDAGVGEVIIGFDGGTKEIYEMHRERLNFEKVLGNIKQFVKLRDDLNSHTRVRIKYVRTTKNKHEVMLCWKMFSEFLDPDLDTFEDSLAIDWGDKTAENAGLYYFPKKRRDNRNEVTSRDVGCVSVDNTLVVQPDGIIGACCWDYNREVSGGGFGKFDTGATLLDIWRSLKRARLIAKLKEGSEIPEKCNECVTYNQQDNVYELIEIIDRQHLVEKYSTGFVYRFPNGRFEFLWKEVGKLREAHDYQSKQAANWRREYDYQLEQTRNWKKAYEQLRNTAKPLPQRIAHATKSRPPITEFAIYDTWKNKLSEKYQKRIQDIKDKLKTD